MRNLTKTLVAVSLLTSTSVHSLGIGGIKLRSALNQKLNAEIALMTSGAEKIDDIQVKLASPAKFDEAGVPWTYFLTKIKFNPVTKADGSIVVKLTSDEVLKEPYLDFLLEVTGPSGSLYREFTVLVDPPVGYKPAQIPVVTHAARVREPEIYEQNETPEPLVQGSRNHYQAQPVSGDVNESEYGPVRKSDTIWSIANQVKPDGVSAAQMVMAIYEANPGAFSRPNVNALLKGSTLAIPDHDQAVQLSAAEALEIFKQHGNAWRAESPPVIKHVVEHKAKPRPRPVKTEIEPVAAKPVEPIKQLKLAPPIEAELADAEETTSLAGNKKDAAAAAVDILSETKAIASQEDADLKQRFDRIEQQLQMMQKMLELKDAQLASLQNKSPVDVTVNSLTAPENKLPAVKTADVNPLEPQQIDKSLQTKTEEAIAIPETIAPAPKPAAKPTPTVVNPVQDTTGQASLLDNFSDYYLLAGGIGATLLSALGLIWWRKRKTDQEIDTESMFASASQINLPDTEKEVTKPVTQKSNYDSGIVAESAFLSEFTPSEFDAFETDQTEIDPMSEADVYLAYGRYQQAEELIRQVISDHPSRNDCKLKLLEIYQASENKPEFNQYVRQLINDGKQSDTVFWAKVVEMADEFTPGAGALISLSDESAVQGNATISPSLNLEKMNAISNDLDVDFDKLGNDDNFTATVTEAVNNDYKESIPSVDEQSFSSNTRFGSNDIDLSIPELSSEDATLDLSVNDDNGIDFDLSDFKIDKSNLEDDAIEFLSDTETNDADFDLSRFALENSVIEGEQLEFLAEDDTNDLSLDMHTFDEDFSASISFDAKDAHQTPKEIDEDFDFNFSLEDEPKAKSKHLELDQAIDFSDESQLDLEGIDFSTDSIKLLNESEDTDALSEEEFDFEFDFKPAETKESNKPDLSFKLNDVDDLTDSYSAFETKINLANAYVDMGDIEAAKVIANDLLKGTAEQIKAGKEIIEKIS